MILLTVGTQLPFDRLVRAMDEWAKANPHIEVFAQIANGEYIPKHMEYVGFLGQKHFESLFAQSELVIAHAGMGSVISSLISAKPVVIFPRRASLGEHRNEHQLATCQKLSSLKGCYVAHEPDDLYSILDEQHQLEGGAIGPFANPQLLQTIENFILQ
jgi:UDP-N-acetylglucosamine transferase subunit ALG13|tara:strand:+ start:7419 stop:7892 length:474 start_codon:yes stop_codon:yes gene_type:complete